VIESGADYSARVLLRPAYGRRMLLRGDAATVPGLLVALTEVTGAAGVRAVDLSMHPHGTTQRLVLADAAVDVDDVATQVLAVLGEEQRHRLRAVISTACYGASHLDAWLRAGFVAATGARGIYADGLTSVPATFRAWAARRTLEQCVQAANDHPTRHAQDWVASRYYAWTGRSGQAERVDSTRVLGGSGAVRIDADPAVMRER
jgi:hypothetical protein